MPAPVHVPLAIVGHLREGLYIAMGSAAERLAVLTLPGALAHVPAYESALWTIEATRTLLDVVGLSKPSPEVGITLESSQYPFLVFKILESCHKSELARSQDREVLGLRRGSRDEGALEVFVAALKRTATNSSQAREERAVLGAINTGRIE